MYFGATPFSAAAFSDVGFNPNAFVSITGQRINVSVGNVTQAADANFSITGQRLNISTGNSTIVGEALVALTGNRLNVAKGTA